MVGVHQIKAVKNVDLWQQLDQAIAAHKVTWEWVKGHAGHPQNDAATSLRGCSEQT